MRVQSLFRKNGITAKLLHQSSQPVRLVPESRSGKDGKILDLGNFIGLEIFLMRVLLIFGLNAVCWDLG